MVVMTAPKVRMSKKFRHMKSRTARSTSAPASFFALISFFRASGFREAALSMPTERKPSLSLRLRGMPSFT